LNEFQGKVKKIRDLIKRTENDALLISQQKNFSWLTSGRSFVNMSVEKSVASILVTSTLVVLIVNNIESARLLEEEITDHFDKIEVFPWYDPGRSDAIIQKYCQGIIETDTSLESELSAIRTVLTDNELNRIKHLGIEIARAIEQTTTQIQPGQSEYDISAQLSANCLQREIEPIVNLVAVDERAFSRRHPLPTSRTLANYAMLVVCGRNKGQVVSATRLVYFGKPQADLLNRHRAVSEIDSILISNTTPGNSFISLFNLMKKAYSDVGYANEWQNHHQGGLTGYFAREQLLLPNSRHTVLDRQAYAWNPSITGVKSEDTILINGSTTDIITHSGSFPTIEIKCEGNIILRPDILVRRHYY
jgi:Xaa-Pro aminopeptidase